MQGRQSGVHLQGYAPKQYSDCDFIDDWKRYLDHRRIDFSDRYGRNPSCGFTLRDFDLIMTIGKGTFGKVVLAKAVSKEEFWTIKIIEKNKIVNLNQIQRKSNEKRILSATRFPFILHLEGHFMDSTYIYFVLSYVPGGTIASLLKKNGALEEQVSAFIAAQVVLAVEYLHTLDIIHRDLKPENLLIDETGYIKLTGFSLAKLVPKRTYTLCGTPDYIAPEMIFRQPYAKAVDWWAFGVLVYELCSGLPPFHSADETITYESIVNGNFMYPCGFSNALKDIIGRLLQVDPSRRLGNLNGGVNDIKNHAWFKGVNWLDVANKRATAPYVPMVKFRGDTSNYEDCGELSLMHLREDKYGHLFADF